MTLSRGERIKEFVLLSVMSIGLPSWDAYADVYLAISAIMNGQVIWGSLLLAPVLLNLIFVSIAWWKFEDPGAKKYTWILVLLCFWPQYRAFRLMFVICWKGEEEGMKEKKWFEQKVGTLEPFLEAMPQVRINKYSLH